MLAIAGNLDALAWLIELRADERMQRYQRHTIPDEQMMLSDL